jgi:hypothetical protein
VNSIRSSAYHCELCNCVREGGDREDRSWLFSEVFCDSEARGGSRIGT